MSKSRDYADLKQDLDNAAFTGLYSDLDGLPTIPTSVSQLTNDTGFITAADAGAVSSVNSYTGAVTLAFDDLSDVTTSAAGTNKFLTKTGSTYLFTSLPVQTPSISDAASTGTALTIFSNKQAKFHSDLEVLGSIYVSGTVDGVDIAARNANLTTAESNITTLQSDQTSTQSDLDTLEASVASFNSLAGGQLATNGGKITALEAKTNLTDFTNDISEVTSTVPTSGSGKPAGYVWYIV